MYIPTKEDRRIRYKALFIEAEEVLTELGKEYTTADVIAFAQTIATVNLHEVINRVGSRNQY